MSAHTVKLASAPFTAHLNALSRDAPTRQVEHEMRLTCMLRGTREPTEATIAQMLPLLPPNPAPSGPPDSLRH